MLREHAQTQARLLIEKLLSLKDEYSPLNLIFDSVEQSARPLLLEYIRRAHTNGISVILVSFDTLVAPFGVKHFVEARRQEIRALRDEVKTLAQATKGCIIVFDSVSQLLANENYLPDFLSDIGGPNIRLVLACHVSDDRELSPGHYVPKPMQMLEHMATTVVKVFALSQVLARKIANDHSKAEPAFGVDAEIEGVVVGTGANPKEGLMAQVEYRRKSGRAVGLTFVMNPSSDMSSPPDIVLSQEHPNLTTVPGDLMAGGNEHHDSTFKLGLTAEQKKARDNVILPYYDAQIGSGEGGRILYEMDREDDFDEEEDEI